MVRAAVVAVLATFAALVSGGKISSLPGQPSNVDFEQYGGYISFTGEGQTSTKSLYYYFQMSAKKDSPQNIPLFFWTNGGPGCSGLLGAFTENGGLRIQSDGTLAYNEYGWNQLVHMVFVEQPAGVGFSYSSDSSDYTTGDTQAVSDFYQFIKGFLNAFPSLAGNDIYISSESYGGHYMPLLAQYIVDHNTGSNAFNFKGFVVGNPYTDPVENSKGMYDTFFGHSMVPLPLWKQYQSVCDDGKNYDSSQCRSVTNAMENAVGNIYYYGLDYPVCEGNNEDPLSEQSHFMDTVLRKGLGRATGFPRYSDSTPSEREAALSRQPRKKQHNSNNVTDGGGSLYDACAASYLKSYLNREDVQQAMYAHVGNGGNNWNECGGKIHWNSTDFEVYMEPVYQYLINGGYGLHILVFSGDDDSVCGTIGTQSWIWQLGYSAGTTWQPWMFDDPAKGRQVAGFWVRFMNGRNKAFTFATVHSAGHEVPWYKPQKAYDLLNKYLQNEF